MSNDPFDLERFLDTAITAISKPMITGDNEALAKCFGASNACTFAFVAACHFLDQDAKATLVGLFRELVFITRHRELPSGRHVEAAQEEFLSLYTSLLDMMAAD